MREIDPAEVGARSFYKLMTASIVPRPIAWVSSCSADGVGNLAPHSFFTCSCTDPPVLQFTSVGRKDSLRNIEETEEFVICFAGEDQFELINASATNFPAELSEFDETGIGTQASVKVTPPRVAGSPVAFECRLEDTISFGNSTVIFGRVVHAAVDADVLGADGLPEIEKLRPMARLGRNQWLALDGVRRIDRIPYREWPGHAADIIGGDGAG